MKLLRRVLSWDYKNKEGTEIRCPKVIFSKTWFHVVGWVMSSDWISDIFIEFACYGTNEFLSWITRFSTKHLFLYISLLFSTFFHGLIYMPA